MQLRVLGCHGGESLDHFATSFQIDHSIILDAGSITRRLTLDEQIAIDAIVLSHSHLDHVRDLASVIDNVIGFKQAPLRVYCSHETAQALHAHFFNDVLWPDFTRIANPLKPNEKCIEILPQKPYEPFALKQYKAWFVPMNHPVPCHSIFLDWGVGAFAYSGDTGPTDAFFEQVQQLPQLKAFIYEVSFPNDMKWLADVSGHLTPDMLGQELQKLPASFQGDILLYHMKPCFLDVLEEQVHALKRKKMKLLQAQDVFCYA